MTHDSSTPWCGIGLAGIMEECGLKHVIPKGSAAAISWVECGAPCEPKPGAIAVFPRTGGNHVTVIKSIDGHTWHCIGGNQSDSICTAPFDGRTARGAGHDAVRTLDCERRRARASRWRLQKNGHAAPERRRVDLHNINKPRPSLLERSMSTADPDAREIGAVPRPALVAKPRAAWAPRSV